MEMKEKINWCPHSFHNLSLFNSCWILGGENCTNFNAIAERIIEIHPYFQNMR